MAERAVRRKMVATAMAVSAALFVAPNAEQPRSDAPPRVLGITTDNPIDAYYSEFAQAAAPVQWTGNRDACDAGTISDEYRADVLDRVNYFREISGVDPVVTNTDLSTSAQAAALIQSYLDLPDHEPEFAADCYTAAGATGSRQSLLHLWNGLGAIDHFMFDYGSRNMEVGHRAWLISPDITEIGIGEIPGHYKEDAIAIQVIGSYDRSRAGRSDHPYVAWPSPGTVPDDFLEPIDRESLRWSVQRRNTVFTGASVTVRRDGATIPTTVAFRANEAYIHTAAAGIITWTVDAAIVPGATYDVTVSGATIDGAVQPDWSYSITVFDTDAYEANAVATVGTVVDRVFFDFTTKPPTNKQRAMWSAQILAAGNQELLIAELATSPEFSSVIVSQMYEDTLGRPGESGGVDYWSSKIQAGTPIRDVAASFYGSPEYVARYGRGNHKVWLYDLYDKLLGRKPDADGLAYWLAETERTSPQLVARRFYQSAESRQARVETLYRRLLNRPPDAAGLAYWTDQLKTTDDIRLAIQLASSREYQSLGR